MAQVKICGLREPAHVDAAIEAGASYIGLVFFDRSPRNIKPADAAALAANIPPGVMRVGLFVNPSDEDLDRICASVPLDMIQLHGAEPPARVTDIRTRLGLPVMKAVGIAGRDDLDALWDYGLVADMLLVDAKPPKDAPLPGGNGLSFDWRLLAGRKWLRPWMLAGGLTQDNVAEAIRLTGAPAVDVSSGVETSPGLKDAALIARFIKQAGGTAPL
ncbi:MAG: phosphoribosylanthranilate isomerase [Paracoccus sp. (in: a-proteobacteria)]|nr:phosphoribosylanthranilate isomerase [Paracoccus sp. (in: a-proteobacteria)]